MNYRVSSHVIYNYNLLFKAPSKEFEYEMFALFCNDGGLARDLI